MINLNSLELLQVSGGKNYSAAYCSNQQDKYFIGIHSNECCHDINIKPFCKRQGYEDGFCKNYGDLDKKTVKSLNLVYDQLNAYESYDREWCFEHGEIEL